VFLILALGFFLIGGIGLAVDGGNIWFHRQTAQTAADAACTAGAMDLLSVTAGADIPGTPWTTSAGSYAGLNGYSSGVAVDTSPTFTGLDDKLCDYSNTVCDARDNGLVASPYFQVTVTDPVPTTFMRFLGFNSTNVPARSTCGLSNVLSPVPVLVLNPNLQDTLTGSGSLTVEVSGSTNIPKLIQVNSVQGTSLNFTGRVILTNADGTTPGVFAVAGRQGAELAGGSTDKWVNAAGVMSDPFASITPPQSSKLKDCSNILNCVTYGAAGGTLGCPSGVSCDVYSAGYYPTFQDCPGAINGQAAICVGKGRQPVSSPTTATGVAVFEPGQYYLGEDLYADDTSCLRPSSSVGDGSGGSMFYLSNLAVLDVASGSGGTCPTSISLASTLCPGSSLSLPAVSITGNVLLAPCTGPYGDLTGTGNRGILFFHDRDVQPAQPRWLESGSYALVGNIYFHYCNSTSAPGTGSGVSCAPSAFTQTLALDGGTNSYIVGGIVVDQLQINSGADIHVILNPNPQYYVLKASLLQ
jgi:hypothetical protein